MLLTATLLCVGSVARSIGYPLPDEPIPASLAGPEAEIVRANCAGCHSLDYLSTQPRGKGAQFWRDAVIKMITVYGAPVAPADVDAISAFLAKAYGSPG